MYMQLRVFSSYVELKKKKPEYFFQSKNTFQNEQYDFTVSPYVGDFLFCVHFNYFYILFYFRCAQFLRRM